MNAVNKAFKFLATTLLFWLLINLFIAAHSPLFPSITKMLANIPLEIFLFLIVVINVIYLQNEPYFQALLSAINLKNKRSIDESISILKKLKQSDKTLMIALFIYLLGLLMTMGALLSVFFSFSNALLMWVLYLFSLALIAWVLDRVIASWAEYHLNNFETIRSK